MTRPNYLQLIMLSLLTLTLSTHYVLADTRPGSDEDIAYAHQLWQRLITAQIVGPEVKPLKPFFGGARPHGMILEVTHQSLDVAGYKGFLVLKKNYNGEGVSVENVKNDRKKYLSSITVMFQREKGYDPDNLNWFWAKYQPDGSLSIKETPKGTLLLAGRLIKGKDAASNKGCLYCHSSAGGGDYIFYPEITLPGHKYP